MHSLRVRYCLKANKIQCFKRRERKVLIPLEPAGSRNPAGPCVSGCTVSLVWSACDQFWVREITLDPH